MSNTFNAAGANATARVTFNQGTIDFGNNRIVELDNIAVNIEWTTNPLYVLGSIVPQDLVRHTQKISMTGKLKSFPAELYTVGMGSSTLGTPNEIDPLDGQPTYQSPVVTLFDRNNKQYQYQLSGAIFKSIKLGARMEEYAEFDFELEAKQMVLVYTT